MPDRRIILILRTFLLVSITLAVSQSDAQSVITAGDSILWRGDERPNLYEGDSMIIDNKIERLNNELVTYDYNLFKKYVAAAVKYESQMLDRVNHNSINTYELEDQIAYEKSTGNEMVVKRLSIKLDSLLVVRQNDQRKLSYSRSLLQRILKIGKKGTYKKLAKVYVPGLNDQVLHEAQTEDLVESQISDLSHNKKQSNLPPGDVIKPDQEESKIVMIPEQREDPARERVEEEEDVAPRKDKQKGKKEVETDIETKAPLGNEVVKSKRVEETNHNVRGQESHTVSEVIDIPYLESPGTKWFTPTDPPTPTYECSYTFHGIDAFTNRQKRELSEESFFTYTDERLKPYLQDRDYVTCNGYLTSISGGYRYLTLKFKISSRRAKQEYGYIRKDALLNIKLLSGETISLFAQTDSQGIQNPKDGSTEYKVRYPIDYQKEKLLLKSGIDQVRVIWSSGYEDYDVFNIDFFINQLNCLNKKQQ